MVFGLADDIEKTRKLPSLSTVQAIHYIELANLRTAFGVVSELAINFNSRLAPLSLERGSELEMAGLER